MKKLVLLSLTCGSFVLSVHAQTQGLWKPASETAISQKAKTNFDQHFKPSSFKIFSLKEDDLTNALSKAPAEKNMIVSRSGKIITIPDADGTMQQFRIVQTSV